MSKPTKSVSGGIANCSRRRTSPTPQPASQTEWTVREFLRRSRKMYLTLNGDSSTCQVEFFRDSYRLCTAQDRCGEKLTAGRRLEQTRQAPMSRMVVARNGFVKACLW